MFFHQQISGCRDRPEAIKPDHLLEEFVSVLRQHHPCLLEKAQERANQGWQCNAWENENLQAIAVGDTSSSYLETTERKRKTTSVLEQAKLSLLIDDDVCTESKKGGSFMFSFM